MSLSITIFLLHTISAGGPLEMKMNEESEKKPIEPHRAVIHDGDNKELEEDIKWLMT